MRLTLKQVCREDPKWLVHSYVPRRLETELCRNLRRVTLFSSEAADPMVYSETWTSVRTAVCVTESDRVMYGSEHVYKSGYKTGMSESVNLIVNEWGKRSESQLTDTMSRKQELYLHTSCGKAEIDVMTFNTLKSRNTILHSQSPTFSMAITSGLNWSN